jgi:glycosyl transferase family 2
VTRPHAVSIVVPTRNRSDWLPRALDSVLAQDHPNLELVVVDDGSQDDTPAVLANYTRRYPSDRFRFLSQANAGQGAAINLGWELARGEFLGYLADDDTLAPSAVSRLVQTLGSDPAAAIAYPAYRVVDEHGEIANTVMPIEYSPEAAIRLHDTVIGPGALVRRSALERGGGWETTLRWMGDLLLWMKLGLQGRAVRVPEILASWTRHGGCTTLELSAAHAREHLRVAELGLSLPGLPPQSLEQRAEAVRNACVHAALFAGKAGLWSDRYTVIDLHRPLYSGWAARADRTALPGSAGAETAALWREVAAAIGETIETPEPEPTAAGLAPALECLRAVGAWSGGPADPEARGDRLRAALLEAAVLCGADTDPDRTRFLILDGESAGESSRELRELAKRAFFGFRVSPDELRSGLVRRTTA